MKSNPRISWMWPVRQFALRQLSKIAAIADETEGLVLAAATIHGWVSGDAAREMARLSRNLRGDPTIVEVGVFMGRSTALLAGARRRLATGTVHCVDPFDCSGDAVSAPVYEILRNISGTKSTEAIFLENMSKLNLTNRIVVHAKPSHEQALAWDKPIDLLLLDADHSPSGAKEVFDDWVKFLTVGGVLILHNTGNREYRSGHNGNRLLQINEVIPPKFCDIRTIGTTTFAVKTL